ncbi:biotin synthase BioB [Lutimonas zeaxanthinifaciens]|uniref:biotin synthase BioB n=1 Tax=Lutimonas zeaxanthinifaciens TaxID=3060215 RepID=UPI00265CB67F|nr:biotin synthase BioB [Lutimonas sp. YSD2104]WKK65284.1 biotin synthase BioB [Lutimonas sp. YSD2104]
MKTYSKEEIIEIYNRPLMQLVYDAATVHRENHDPSKIQVSTLISIKTGGCPEDCGYCPQAARYHTQIEKNDLLPYDTVINLAKRAKDNGSSRVCMGAAWRNVKEGEDFESVLKMVSGISDLNMEVCCTLGMVTENQATRLAEAGLHYYNHNLDTSEEYYKEVISTRGYEDRLQTLDNVRKSALKVCSGGIIGMGESIEDRAGMLLSLSKLDPQPESVPINALVAVEGTPLEEQQVVPVYDVVRMIATTRIVMPKTTVRLSAGRTEMSSEGQALCFMAGASSIFAGEKLLTTPNPGEDKDAQMFETLGLTPTQKKKDNSGKFKIRKSLLGKEEQKWSRPGHVIERNVKATEKAKEIRKAIKEQ